MLPFVIVFPINFSHLSKTKKLTSLDNTVTYMRTVTQKSQAEVTDGLQVNEIQPQLYYLHVFNQ